MLDEVRNRFLASEKSKLVFLTYAATALASWTQLLKPIRVRTSTRTQFINSTLQPHLNFPFYPVNIYEPAPAPWYAWGFCTRTSGYGFYPIYVH